MLVLVAIVLGAESRGVAASLEAFGRGVAAVDVGLTRRTVDDGIGVDALDELAATMRASAGMVLVTAEPAEVAERHLSAFHDHAIRSRTDAQLISALAQSVASTLVAAPGEAATGWATIHALNSRLYEWGAVIVSPGFGERALAPWFDNRPGGVAPDGSLEASAAGALERHGHRMGWLAGLLARERGYLSRLQL